MKKVIIMCSSFAIGGAENMVAQLISGLDKKAFNITVIVSNPRLDNHIQKLVETSGVNIIYGSTTEKKSKINRLKTLIKIHKALKQEKPDIIHTNLSIALYAIPYVVFHRVKFIHTVHNIPEKDSNRLMRIIFSLLVKLKKIRFSSISFEIQRRIIQVYHVDPKDAPVIVNPVHCEAYNHDIKQKDGVIRFITVGRLAKQKNQAFLIDAFSQIHQEYPNTTLSIVGDGELKAELERKIIKAHLGHAVNLLGTQSDMPSVYATHDIFVLSSDYEGLPLTILEAEASGLPIISTNVGGVSDIVTDKNGILVEQGNLTQLARAMETLINDSDLRSSLGKASKEEAKKYDVSIFVKKYTELYSGDL